jgi:hypothetical protein
MTPSSVMMPARYISAMISMMPEPQTPVTPTFCGGFVKAGFIRPGLDADNAVARFQCFRIDADALDGAGSGALAAGDLRTLEGRAGGRGGGDGAFRIAKHDLGIGADIDQQHHLVLAVRAFGQRCGRGVGADMAGDAGQHIDPRAGVERQADLG